SSGDRDELVELNEKVAGLFPSEIQ
ncbi:MAG: hypothetical protein JWN28_685, partial [Candidatus Saccharibacteria bacterium]|nr:hypothetical protein [Candidatus Saccharibacteria bacterium]